jgi:hypothetical protein
MFICVVEKSASKRKSSSGSIKSNNEKEKEKDKKKVKADSDSEPNIERKYDGNNDENTPTPRATYVNISDEEQ